MTDQLALVPSEAPKLTDRQQAAYDLIAANDGVDAGEIGANWHHLRGKHSAGGRCDYCETDGRDVCRSKALRPLVTYRRTPAGSLYFLRGTPGPTGEAAGDADGGYDPATSEIPF